LQASRRVDLLGNAQEMAAVEHQWPVETGADHAIQRRDFLGVIEDRRCQAEVEELQERAIRDHDGALWAQCQLHS
jgi:hypothetical protein